MPEAGVAVQGGDDHASSPRCPVCGSSMVRRTARQGVNAGRDFWGCSRFPIDECPGKLDIGPARPKGGGPGAYAQAQADRERRLYKRQRRAMLPALVALVCLIAFGVYLAALPYLGFAAGIPGLVVCIVGMAMIFRLPPEAMWWDKGARGERKTAELLDPLQARGFVLRYGLRMPDERGDIDAVAIGPTGVWVVETKNLSGSVSVVGGKLFVKDQPRQAMIDQVYREAFAVQQIVGDLLAPTITMVTPVLCIHGARMLWLDHSVGGVRVVSGRQLTRLMTDRHEVLDAKLVQEIAALVSRKLREPWSWEGEQ